MIIILGLPKVVPLHLTNYLKNYDIKHIIGRRETNILEN